MPSVQNLHLLTKHVALQRKQPVLMPKLVQDQKVASASMESEAEMAATANENIQKECETSGKVTYYEKISL